MNISAEQRAQLEAVGVAVSENINDVLLDLDDKITEVGFDANYDLNERGLKLQKLYDELYDQN